MTGGAADAAVAQMTRISIACERRADPIKRVQRAGSLWRGGPSSAALLRSRETRADARTWAQVLLLESSSTPLRLPGCLPPSHACDPARLRSQPAPRAWPRQSPRHAWCPTREHGSTPRVQTPGSPGHASLVPPPGPSATAANPRLRLPPHHHHPLPHSATLCRPASPYHSVHLPRPLAAAMPRGRGARPRCPPPPTGSPPPHLPPAACATEREARR